MAALGLATNVGPLAAAEPKGTPVHDPELAALLRPSDPIVEEHLTHAEDGYIYYSANLKHFAKPGLTKRYLAELEDKGLRIIEMGNSPHAAHRRVIGYDFLAWQETSLDPYTIRFREGKDREEAMVHEPPRRPNYAHPVSVTLDRLVVRLPAEFAKPWTTAVVVPKENQAKLPFPIPLPPRTVVRAAWEDRADEWGPTGPRKGRVLAIWISVISRLTPAGIRDFYKQALDEWVKPAPDESTTWRFDHLPPWAPPNATALRVDTTESALFAYGTLGVPDFEAADAFDRRTLPHLPRDVRKYVIIVFLRTDPVK